MIVVVEFYFVHDYSSISMLKTKMNLKNEFLFLLLHRALVSVLIDGDGEFGEESTLGFEY
jgi:hypothetical protein